MPARSKRRVAWRKRDIAASKQRLRRQAAAKRKAQPSSEPWPAGAGIGLAGAVAEARRGRLPREPDHSSLIEAYYALQRILPPGELHHCMRTFRRPLPLSFRINRHTADPTLLEWCLEKAQPLLHPRAPLINAGRPMPPPQHLQWCDAWQLGLSAPQLRTADSFELKRLQEWITEAVSLGVISRQEVVSMIPVAMLQIEPQHRVLDLCASPGSKTTQVLDALHAPAKDSSPQGFVIANDANAKRSFILTRRCAALGAASQCLLVAQHRAQQFPNVAEEGLSDEEPVQLRYVPGQYDRIVCDVPCCGDGTLRKAPDLWRRWVPSYAMKLHALQVQIAMRGLALLRVGGIMAYSTCTMNPLEDEAVVATILQRCGGAVQLMDCSKRLPELIRYPGLATWQVTDDDLNVYPSYKACQDSAAEQYIKDIVRPSMWAPSAEEAAKLRLDRCMRFFPHLQDTGAFFVALLRKVKELPGPGAGSAEDSQAGPKMSAKSRQSDGDGPAKRRPSEPQPDENPDVSPQTAGDRFAAAQGSRSAAVLAAHFQLRSTFERYLLPAMYVRPATTSVGSLSYVAPQLAHHVLDNEAGSRLRRVAVGVKVTENNGRSSLFRLTQAGAQLLYPYAQRQVVRLGVSAFRRLLFNVGARLEADFLGLSAAKVAELQPGPCIIVVQRPKATSCRPAADTRQRRLAVKASRQAAIVAAEGDDEKPFKTRGRLGRGLFKALFTTGESQPLVFAGQFSTDPARLKLCIPFSKGLEPKPKATARALLQILPSKVAATVRQAEPR